MIKNYIKLAWRILGRKKFFTGISLFGISFTLGILMVILSFLQSELGSDAPISDKDDFIYLDYLMLQKIYFDTIMTIDTSLFEGETVYDTSYEHKRTGAARWNSEMNNSIPETYLSNIPSIDNMTIFSNGSTHDVYVNGIKLTLNALYTDSDYFDVLDHTILDGRVFDREEMDQSAKVMLMSDRSAMDYFGRTTDVVDEEIEIDGKNYRVIGTYKHPGKFVPYVSPDIILPYSNLNPDNQPSYYHGYYSVLFKKHSDQDAQNVKEDIKRAANLIPLDHPSKPPGYNEVVLKPTTYDEMFAQAIYHDEDETKSYAILKWVLLSLLAFFVLLPTLNLINLNVSRIMERSSEIGVRKAFGAHQGNIITQFIVENIVQTLIGGVLGLILALSCIHLINSGGYLGDAILSLQPKFFIYCFLVTILFGVVSGLLPAYRMSKLHIVNALNENKL